MIASIAGFIFVSLAVTVIWLITHLVAVVIILSLIAAATTALNIKKLRDSGMFLFQRGSDEIAFRKCTYCDGCGVTLVGGAIIPKEFRTFSNTKEGLVFRGKIANTVTCPVCHGMGGLWLDKNGEKRNNIPAKRIGNKWF